MQVYNGQANVCMGGLGLNSQRSRLLQPLFYHQTSFVLSGVHGQPFSPMEKLYIPFAANTWLATSCLLLLATAIIATLKMLDTPVLRHFIQGATNNMPFFNMIGSFLGLPVTRPTTRTFGRFLIVIWLMAAMILRNAYHGILFNILHQNAMHPPPTRIDQLIAQQYTAYIFPSTMTFISGYTKIHGM